MSETIWSRTDAWVGTQVEDSYVLLDIDVGEYLTLNATAADIWKALEQPTTAAAIEATVVMKYAVDPSECRSAIDTMLTEFHRKGLVSPAG